MLQTKNTLLGKAKVYILVFFTYCLLMNNSLSENHSQTENYAVLTILDKVNSQSDICLLYTSPSPRDRQKSRMPSSA